MRFFYLPFGYQIPSNRELNVALEDFAELLAQDLPLAEIAKRMGTSGATPCVLLRILQERLGPQAK